MTLQQMEYIVAVDRYRHFIKAAEACGVTQSTLSTLIQKLEQELDMVLISNAPQSENLLKIPIYKESFVAYLSPDVVLYSQNKDIVDFCLNE